MAEASTILDRHKMRWAILDRLLTINILTLVSAVFCCLSTLSFTKIQMKLTKIIY